MEGNPRAAVPPRSSLPANYVSLAQLQERRRLNQEQQRKREDQEEEAVREEIRRLNAAGEERPKVRPPLGRWRQKSRDAAAASGEADVEPECGGRNHGRQRSRRRGPSERAAARKSPNAEAGGEEAVDRVDRRRNEKARGKEKEITAKPGRALECQPEKNLEDGNPKARVKAVVCADGAERKKKIPAKTGQALERQPEKKLENVGPPPPSSGNKEEKPNDSRGAFKSRAWKERRPEKKLENVDPPPPSSGDEEENPKDPHGDFKPRVWRVCRRVKISPPMVEAVVDVAQKLENAIISVPAEDCRSSRRPTGGRRRGSRHMSGNFPRDGMVWIKKTGGS
ncbi:unnamed protein product [Spirodela intermedia]|uniref:Uncharacterized protein n=1 Tax=Spirodela intermedia TaxID=51605 RepID=A0A7I8LCY2_SPIIN|nr:unnamed protein product [Spirodela intermedia]